MNCYFSVVDNSQKVITLMHIPEYHIYVMDIFSASILDKLATISRISTPKHGSQIKKTFKNPIYLAVNMQ